MNNIDRDLDQLHYFLQSYVQYSEKLKTIAKHMQSCADTASAILEDAPSKRTLDKLNTTIVYLNHYAQEAQAIGENHLAIVQKNRIDFSNL